MLQEDHDATDLSSAGWGVIFPENADPGILDALGVLLQYRRGQSGPLFRSMRYRCGDEKYDLLSGPGPVEPCFNPYYVLIVGSPKEIPYDFQVSLSLQHAVGRLCFDTLEEYANYAIDVVEAERGKSVPREAAFVGVQNKDDLSTQLAVESLIEPLSLRLRNLFPDWRIDTLLRGLATKSCLVELLEGKEPPALIFTAGHGVLWHPGSPRSSDHGAILCADWPGPLSWRKAIPKEFYFSAGDVPEAASLGGRIIFQFGCFSAGTPETRGRFPVSVSKLPQRLLNQGALAVIGNIGMPFTASFQWNPGRIHINTFEGALRRILKGLPVGFAMEYFSRRHAEIAADLLRLKLTLDGNQSNFPGGLSGTINTAYHDARSYVVLGDPAVRLRF